jgi:hypothetical protein
LGENEKAARQQGDLLFSRENSSNGGLDSVKTFWTKSYEPKKQGVKQFLVNKCLCFHRVTEAINKLAKVFQIETKGS